MQKEVLRKNGEICGLAWGCLLNGDSPEFMICWYCHLVTINIRSGQPFESSIQEKPILFVSKMIKTTGRPKKSRWLDVRFGQKFMKDHVNIAILGGD